MRFCYANSRFTFREAAVLGVEKLILKKYYPLYFLLCI